MSVILAGLNFDELLNLRKEVEQELSSRKQAEVVKLRNETLKRCNDFGITVDELFGKVGKGKYKAGGGAKYANPSDPTQTWTGRGRQPNWIKEAVDGGASLDSFLIN